MSPSVEVHVLQFFPLIVSRKPAEPLVVRTSSAYWVPAVIFGEVANGMSFQAFFIKPDLVPEASSVAGRPEEVEASPTVSVVALEPVT